MFRRLTSVALVIIAAITLTLSALTGTAHAQDPTPTPTPYEPSPYHSANLGDSFVHAIIPPDTYELKADTTTVGGTGGGDVSAGLAATGSQTDALMAGGIALVTFGGTALVASRRRS